MTDDLRLLLENIQQAAVRDPIIIAWNQFGHSAQEAYAILEKAVKEANQMMRGKHG